MPEHRTGINPTILQQHLDSATNAGAKGMAQFFTPVPWAEVLSMPLPGFRHTIVDLNCGNGQLLTGAARGSTQVLLGCDIEPPSTETPDRTWSAALLQQRVTADVTRFYPLLRKINFQADCFVLNPPWDLHWYREPLADLAQSDLVAVAEAFTAHDHRTGREAIDSTIASLCLALDRCSHYGEGFIIGNAATLQRLIFDDKAPHSALAAHVWAYLAIEGNICQKTQPNAPSGFYTAVLWFARSHTSGLHQDMAAAVRGANALENARQICTRFQRQRLEFRQGPSVRSFMHTEDSAELWKAAREEWDFMAGKRNSSSWNLWLDTDGTIRTNLSLFDNASGRVSKEDATQLHQLNGKRPMQLVLQRSDRKALERAANGKLWRVCPDLQAAVRQAITEYNTVRAPLYPLPTIQRLGYLDDSDDILCLADLAGEAGAFRAGHRYAIRTETVRVSRNGSKVNLSGQVDEVEWEGSELAIFITDDTGREHLFMEERLRGPNIHLSWNHSGEPPAIAFTLQQLATHFEIPEVPDVATLRPEEYRRNLSHLHQIESAAGSFRFLKFQLEDYARAAMHDGLILGHDTGGGKGIALFAWSALKTGFEANLDRLQPSAPVLFVVPGDLHEQVISEGALHFKAAVTRLDSQATFLRLATTQPATGKLQLPRGYYITSYTQLSSNNVEPFPSLADTPRQELFDRLNVSASAAAAFHAQRGTHLAKFYSRLHANAEMSLAELQAAHKNRISAYMSKSELKSLMDEAFNAVAPFHGKGRNTPFHKLPPTDQQFVTETLLRCKAREYSAGIGEEHHLPWGKVKCVFSPSLADLSCDTFSVVAVDEGVRMKGDTTIIGRGVRQMNPPCRLVLTATPIKNRFPDVYWLAWWACGGRPLAHARFPYPEAPEARQEFSEEFQVTERTLDEKQCPPDVLQIIQSGRLDGSQFYLPPALDRRTYTRVNRVLEDMGGFWDRRAKTHQFSETAKLSHLLKLNPDRLQKPRYTRSKLTPQVCNIHRAWKLFAPIILRRRKKDFGEDIVPKVRNLVHVPMGTLQAQVYAYHLEADYRDVNGLPAIGAQLQALRIAAANPSSQLLKSLAKHEGLPRSELDYIPKLHSALALIEQILARGEQFIVFSAFNDSLDALSQRLHQAAVPHCVLDGRVSQKRRGEIAGKFKLGPPRAGAVTCSPYPGMLAGLECMAEGHSFPLCNNVIILCYSWAYDKIEQAINRAHRVNSRWPVNVFFLICDGSIDRKLEAGIAEKGEASDLILDGQLLAENQTELSPAELLEIAREEFNAAGTVDESTLELQWPALRDRIHDAAQRWPASYRAGEAKPVTAIEIKPTAPTPKAMPTAPANRLPLPQATMVDLEFESLPLWQQRVRRRAA